MLIFIPRAALICLHSYISFFSKCLSMQTISGSISFVRRFSYRDIKRATDGFRCIIDNPHGVVYKANFQDGSVAMVKEIRDFDNKKDAFYKAVHLLGCLHHRHIVSLCGFSTGRKRFDSNSCFAFENLFF